MFPTNSDISSFFHLYQCYSFTTPYSLNLLCTMPFWYGYVMEKLDIFVTAIFHTDMFKYFLSRMLKELKSPQKNSSAWCTLSDQLQLAEDTLAAVR